MVRLPCSQRIMAGGTRSQSATPTSKRRTRGQSAASESKAEPDKSAKQNGTAQNGAAENPDTHANGASDVSTAPASSGKTSSQDQTYSEQVCAKCSPTNLTTCRCSVGILPAGTMREVTWSVRIAGVDRGGDSRAG